MKRKDRDLIRVEIEGMTQEKIPEAEIEMKGIRKAKIAKQSLSFPTVKLKSIKLTKKVKIKVANLTLKVNHRLRRLRKSQ
jgi:hypothetical protein